MAGSQIISPPSSSLRDPVLSARLDALKLLADRTTDRVMVVDRDGTIIYANHLVGSGDATDGRPAKCYQAILHRQDPCAHCGAMEAFHAGEVRSVSCGSPRKPNDCGMIQAYSLLSARGTTEAVLVILGQGDAAGPGHSPSEETRLGSLIGRSAPMRQLFEMIRLVADSQATVLLQGESGTGKELAARTIHELSYRREKPFVAVDCASLPETLLESELFGHVKGAFTGAVASKKGLFEEADGGTIFLDEITDTSPQFQAKLLRVLQEGEIKPVGSTRQVKVDARVISATNKHLPDLIKAKAFREDLYYRLAVLPLILPPLRDRREDIPFLVRHFVATSCQRHRKPVIEATDEALQALTAAPWPGNVRELQHRIERAVVTAKGARLVSEDFFEPTATATPTETDLRSVGRSAAQQAERARILEVLLQASGNRVKAARLLKISRASLYNKLRAYRID